MEGILLRLSLSAMSRSTSSLPSKSECAADLLWRQGRVVRLAGKPCAASVSPRHDSLGKPVDDGPVVSRIDDPIRSEPALGTDRMWSRRISAPGNYQVSLIADWETDGLSPAEELLIEEVFGRFGKLGRWERVNLSHESPEWQDPRTGAIGIEYRDILARGKQDRE